MDTKYIEVLKKMKRKTIGKKVATLVTVSALAVGCLPMNVFAYGGDVTVDNGAFRTETDNNENYKTWKNDVWDAGERADSGKIALTPGDTEEDLNFAWYSENRGLQPAVKVWEVGKEADANIIKGTSTIIGASNIQGSTYEAYNHVSVEGYFKADTQYQYKYTDNYNGDYTVWSDAMAYNTADTSEYTVIVTGDPQVGASGTTGEGTEDDIDIARDTYNWNKTMEAASEKYPEAAFLLSVGDQVDYASVNTDKQKAIRESEYAGYLYPSIFRSLPIAATIGNHDTQGADYSYHFNNPNSDGNLGATAAGSDFYFSYGDVLFICLNSNNRNQAEHRELMEEAVANNPDAKWRIAYFHADIYGSGTGHSDTDATGIRIVLAPLMDEFDIDICFTGHDHTYSRSYQLLDGNVIDYDIEDGTVTNPEGTMYISTGSGSGSKYYNFVNYTQYYIAERTNVCLPTFSALEIAEDSLTVKTYDYNGAQYADDFTIVKTDDEASAEEVIAKGEARLADTEVEYTAESLATLKEAVATLKELQASYTTAEDLMEELLTKYYNTPNDRCVATGVVRANGKVDGLGYGHVYSADDKDGSANRFKQGLSTLLDKTIYMQNFTDDVSRENLPIIDAVELETAKTSVIEAISALKVVETEQPSKNEQETTTSTVTAIDGIVIDSEEVAEIQKTVVTSGLENDVEIRFSVIKDEEVIAAVKEAVKGIIEDKDYVVTDITLYKSDVKTQVSGDVVIEMNVPSALSGAKKIQVYRLGDDNKLVKVDDSVDVQNGRIKFTTNHFSTYIFADATTAPVTGDNSNMTLYVAVMFIAAGAGLMIFRKKEENCETR